MFLFSSFVEGIQKQYVHALNALLTFIAAQTPPVLMPVQFLNAPACKQRQQIESLRQHLPNVFLQRFKVLKAFSENKPAGHALTGRIQIVVRLRKNTSHPVTVCVSKLLIAKNGNVEAESPLGRRDINGLKTAKHRLNSFSPP
jgi:hypothetical protein